MFKSEHLVISCHLYLLRPVLILMNIFFSFKTFKIVKSFKSFHQKIIGISFIFVNVIMKFCLKFKLLVINIHIIITGFDLSWYNWFSYSAALVIWNSVSSHELYRCSVLIKKRKSVTFLSASSLLRKVTTSLRLHWIQMSSSLINFWILRSTFCFPSWLQTKFLFSLFNGLTFEQNNKHYFRTTSWNYVFLNVGKYRKNRNSKKWYVALL